MTETVHHLSCKFKRGETTIKLNLTWNVGAEPFAGGDLDIRSWGPDGPQEDKGISMSIGQVTIWGLEGFCRYAGHTYGVDIWQRVQEMIATIK